MHEAQISPPIFIGKELKANHLEQQFGCQAGFNKPALYVFLMWMPNPQQGCEGQSYHFKGYVHLDCFDNELLI